MERKPTRSPTTTRRPAAFWTVAVVALSAAGVTAVLSHKLGVAAGLAILLAGILVADPVLVAVLAFPGAFLLMRVGGSSTNLSLSDLVVFVAALASLTQVDWSRARGLRAFLTTFLAYEAVLIVVVAVHPNRYDIVEWFHRMSDVAGSVVIGWVVATRGRIRVAVRLYLAAASAVALVAIVTALRLHFAPAQWGLYQKNAVGAMMWVAVVVAQLNPRWLGLTTRWARIPEGLCFLGLLASQSRQSMIVLIGALILATMVRSDIHRRSKLIFVFVLPLAVLAYVSFQNQFAVNPKFNSVAIRVDQLGIALNVWHQNPWLGQGMRFYNLPQFAGVPVPPNVVIGGLASTGVVGVAALLVFFGTSFGVMARLPRAYGVMGLAILAGHYVEGLFDIFWIGAYAAIPFLMVGLCLGAADGDLLGLAGRDEAATRRTVGILRTPP
ncbi:MAG: O-antigen ligase family protein [Actinomycetota bacterium]|jgi:hypothetical protein|nr:O-antigen ligase family protein [Actinomycetota bacterium]